MRCTHHHQVSLNSKEILQSFWCTLRPCTCTQNPFSCDHTNNLVGHILIVWAIPRSKGQEFITSKLTQVKRSLQVPTAHSWMESCPVPASPLLSGGHSSAPADREHPGVTTQRSLWWSSSHGNEIQQWLHYRGLNNLSKRTIIPVSLALSNKLCRNFLISFYSFSSACLHSSNTSEILHLPRATAPWSLKLQPWDRKRSGIDLIAGYHEECRIQDIPIMYTNNNFEKIVQGIVFLKFLRQPLFAEQLVQMAAIDAQIS